MAKGRKSKTGKLTTGSASRKPAKPKVKRQSGGKKKPGSGRTRIKSRGELVIDHPIYPNTSYDIVLLSSTDKINCDGHLNPIGGESLSINNAAGYVRVELDAPSGQVLATVPSNTAWNKTNLPCEPGIRTLTAYAMYESGKTDQSDPCEFIALPRKHYVTISDVDNGAVCTTCYNAQDTFELNFDAATETWKKTIPAVCTYYSLATLSIVGGGETAYVQFWIKKAGLGAPLMTYINDAWDYQYPIQLEYYADNGLCDWSEATVEINV